MSEYAEKLRSLNLSRPSDRGTKVTVDVHDNHMVEVTETWDDRVGVGVHLGAQPTTKEHPKTVARVSDSVEENRGI